MNDENTIQHNRLCPKCTIIWDKHKLGSDCPKCKANSFMTMNTGDIGTAMFLDQSKLTLNNFNPYEE